MIIAIILVILGLVLLAGGGFSAVKKRKPKVPEAALQSEGAALKNPYIIKHEKKLADDAEYEEYLEWCRFKGEVPVEKDGFDEHRMEEYHLYKKLIKHGISGL